jgi:hypothetical protein
MALHYYQNQLLAVCMTCFITTSTFAANEKSTEFRAELAIGAEYDSNVTVDEVDLNSSQGDYALTLNANVGLHSQLSEKAELDLSYDYSQSSYAEFSQVNRQTHILGSSLDFTHREIDSGISLFYIVSNLDHKKFLEFYRVSPSISGFLAKKWFGRAAYIYSDKVIEERRARSAISNAGEIDIYYFRRGLRSYFNFGYQYKNEDAHASEFDYKSGNLKLRYIHRVDLFSRVAIFQLAFRYEDRDYSSDTPSIEKERRDQRQRWRAELKVPVITNGEIQFYAGYSDYESNLPRADYRQDIVGTRFIYRW